MKNFRNSYIVIFLFSILLMACKKDETSTYSPTILRGIYSFSNNSNLEMFRWGGGGVEKTIGDIEKNAIIDDYNSFTEGVYYNFLSDTLIQFVDTANHTTDSVLYKIMSDIVYIDVRDIPWLNVDYYPLFKISGNTLYAISQEVDLRDQSGTFGMHMTSVDNSYLVDSMLSNKGYNSLTELNANEELTYVKYKKNYTK